MTAATNVTSVTGETPSAENRKMFWEKYENPYKNQEESDNPFDSGGVKMAQTLNGYVPMKPSLMYHECFDLHLMHTNFDISDIIVARLNAVPGVEVLVPRSRYMAIVGLKTTAKLFDAEDVKEDVEAACGVKNDLSALFHYSDATKSEVRAARKRCRKGKGHWAIYVLPNGKVDTVASSRITDEYAARLEMFEYLHANFGGALIKSPVAPSIPDTEVSP